MSKNKIRELTLEFTPEDTIDVRLIIEGKELTGFVLSYRIYYDKKWYEVIRYDTCHGYLHMQKFWISDRPIRIPGYGHLSMEVSKEVLWKDLKDNWQRYKENMIKKLRGF
jgi:hypothetical protein